MSEPVGEPRTNKVKCAFFAATEIPDPDRQAEFNWWHSCEHQPENWATDGVAFGTRWAAPKRYIDARTTPYPDLMRHQYISFYLYTRPIEEIQKLFPRSQHAQLTSFKGKRNAWSLGFPAFRKAYIASRMNLSSEALPYRPNRGGLVVVHDISDAGKVGKALRWFDEVHIPDMLTVKGVMGCYRFQGQGPQLGGASHGGEQVERQVLLYFLDEDAMQVREDLKSKGVQWKAAGRVPDISESMQPVLNAPYMSIPDPVAFDLHKA